MPEKKNLSTYDAFIQDPEQKRLLDSEYQELLLSELFLALMDEDSISVRKLAEAANVSPTIIQELRTGKKENLTLKTFLLLINSLGYSLVLEKNSIPDQPKVKHKRKKIRFRLSTKTPSIQRRRKPRKIDCSRPRRSRSRLSLKENR